MAELPPPLLALQERLQHRFEQPALLQLALTHRSFSSQHYERLEFLGDSVLNLSISQILYQALSEMTEGELSRIRANLVRQETLHQLALDLGLTGLIRLGEGELCSGRCPRSPDRRGFSRCRLCCRQRPGAATL
jgi:ribonuclease III